MTDVRAESRRQPLTASSDPLFLLLSARRASLLCGFICNYSFYPAAAFEPDELQTAAGESAEQEVNPDGGRR